MYNLRYHIASLVAVFLALTVGLLLGTVVVERGALDRQRKALVQGLQKDFESLKSENTKLRSAAARDGAFAKAAFPALAKGALKGRRVLVIGNAGRMDGLTQLSDAVEAAGGSIIVITFERPEFGLDDETVAAKIGPVVGRPGAEGLVRRTADVLASEVMTAGPRPVLDALAAVQQVTLRDPLPERVEAAAVLASFDGRPDPMLVRLGRALADAGLPVVGLETSGTKTGVAVSSAEAGISSVDDLDVPEGQFSAVWVLAGRAKGRFGERGGVQAPFPAIDR